MRRVATILAIGWTAVQIAASQALTEYAVRGAGGALAGSGGEQAHLGACALNSQFLTCSQHYYPKTTLIVGVLAALLVVRWLFRIVRAGSR